MKTRHLLSCVITAVAASVLVAAPAFSDSEFDGNLGGSDGAWGWKPPSHDRIGSNDGGSSGHMYAIEDRYGNGNGGGCGGGSCGGGRGVFNGPFGGGLGGGNALIPLVISSMGGGSGMVKPSGFFPGMNAGMPGLNGGYPGGNNGLEQRNPYGVIPGTPTATPTATPTPTPATIARRRVQ